MVKIITDTTSCLSPEIARRYDIPVIPQIINFGNDSYYEGIDMDNAAFIQRLKASAEIPKTAAPSPELFIEEFARMVPSGETILCLHPSDMLSGTVRSAQVAAQDFPGADIRVIDTRLVSTPLGSLVQLAAEWAWEGYSADEIVARINNLIPRCRIFFLVDTLEYLARGGRIGGAQALLGSILQIKPILTIHDGQVDTLEKERTHKRALARLKEITLQQVPHHGEGYLTVMHAGVPDLGQSLAEELGQIIDQPFVPIADVPPAIVTHGGPGILGVGFFTAK
jgi:DegV family protein with EDD domain